MENEKIIVSVHLRNKLNKLVYIIFEKEYFGYVELAQDYINKIYDFAYSIPNKKHHKTQNDTFGKWYVVYKPNKGRTSLLYHFR